MAVGHSRRRGEAAAGVELPDRLPIGRVQGRDAAGRVANQRDESLRTFLVNDDGRSVDSPTHRLPPFPRTVGNCKRLDGLAA